MDEGWGLALEKSVQVGFFGSKSIFGFNLSPRLTIKNNGLWLTERHKRALYEALEKVKAELMILGFISLILVFCQYYIADICIPVHVADTMLPCLAKDLHKKTENPKRRLLSYERRVLAASKHPSCKGGHVSLISLNGLHQIHILIFFLAVFHVAYSAITMGLGKLKTRRWKQWEQETSSHDYEFSHGISQPVLIHWNGSSDRQITLYLLFCYLSSDKICFSWFYCLNFEFTLN